MTSLEGFVVFSMLLNVILLFIVLLQCGVNRNDSRTAQLLGYDGWSKDIYGWFHHPKLTDKSVTLNQAWQIRKLYKLPESNGLIETICQKRRRNAAL